MIAKAPSPRLSHKGRGSGSGRRLIECAAMNVQFLFWSFLAVVALLALPIVLIRSAIDYFRGRGSQRQGAGGISAGVAGAMQELDRLVARPSVEHHLEAKQEDLKREDDSGGA